MISIIISEKDNIEWFDTEETIPVLSGKKKLPLILFKKFLQKEQEFFDIFRINSLTKGNFILKGIAPHFTKFEEFFILLFCTCVHKNKLPERGFKVWLILLNCAEDEIT
ncbi:hypothetical protein KKC1_29750 [Calderihabitans maritimus]|uniref:Uncharacterized protein n=1 Tax=Calderihabitans maritimus TaxID=1246530 RepID=A0A1Z5HX39_9FIRM|nr:hypothetical protein KKC1_29750 [Calderihabitans maritimus]